MVGCDATGQSAPHKVRVRPALTDRRSLPGPLRPQQPAGLPGIAQSLREWVGFRSRLHHHAQPHPRCRRNRTLFWTSAVRLRGASLAPRPAGSLRSRPFAPGERIRPWPPCSTSSPLPTESNTFLDVGGSIARRIPGAAPCGLAVLAPVRSRRTGPSLATMLNLIPAADGIEHFFGRRRFDCAAHPWRRALRARCARARSLPANGSVPGHHAQPHPRCRRNRTLFWTSAVRLRGASLAPRPAGSLRSRPFAPGERVRSPAAASGCRQARPGAAPFRFGAASVAARSPSRSSGRQRPWSRRSRPSLP
ncbi:MAG: hypothetical protein KatS3mg121_1236 [Gammaproteobacteria bacterium]|nr:MAG: hypothetical protein KatS3mg121_1236 [Gammaproteobacteria bacterium]